MQDLIHRYTDLLERIQSAIAKLGIPADATEIAKLSAATQAPDFWNDPQAAAKTSQRLAELTKHVESWRSLESQVSDELFGVTDIPGYAETAEATYSRLKTDYEAREFELKLSGPHDRTGAIIELHAGTGGTDAQDWTEMLQRMYVRWATSQNFSAEILSTSPGEEAGIKSATIEISGPFAFGKLKGEAGVHRLVRQSPFNSADLRQTSFALVEVLPQLDRSTADIELDPKDLRIDVYRSSGKGGQSVNTTDSAVRITHIPTNTVVAIQNERSQLQNKDKAMAVLKARLAARLEAEQAAELGQLRGADKAAEWGQQIRNYVLHPYTKVKDVRTGAETNDAAGVLDGNLDLFIEAYLNGQIGSGSDD
ncbi:peptide chain release factor 2 [Candidatus Saccharibacteria bacterium]|nr:peptide chain release factor 2 [Candidatus Saccharibacteria bacterium]